MPRCPFGPHRLSLKEDFACKRCGVDLRFYVAVRDLHLSYYNQARRLWDESELEEAAAWLQAALKLHPDFAEGHWLLGVVEARRDRIESAMRHIIKAQELGAGAGNGRFASFCEEPTASEEAVESRIESVEEELDIAENQVAAPAVAKARPLRAFLVSLKNFFAITIGRTDGTRDVAYTNKSGPAPSGAIAATLPETACPAQDVSPIEDVPSLPEREITAQNVDREEAE